jgi:glycogen operon protein
MVVGEDLGTVPAGFRDDLTRANILGMRVLRFEHDGPKIRPPADYPPISVACLVTHDLPTLSGWWEGVDVAERVSLGLLSLAKAGDEIAARREEKRGLIAALVTAGLVVGGLTDDAPLSDSIAAAVHALIAASRSIFAHAQFDDLLAERVATNLPGTDRERPNWRLKVGPDVAAAFASARTRAILAALSKGRT